MFWSNFSSLCAQRGMSPNAVARDLAIPSGSITAWKEGSEPRNKTLVKIADYFNVSVAFLLEDHSDKKEKPLTVNGEELNYSDVQLLEAIHRADPKDLKAIRVILGIE